jgi:hypothetical protein
MAPGKAAKQLKELQNLARNAKESEKIKVTDTSLTLVDHFKLDWTEKRFLKEEVFSEYLNFMRNFPHFLDSEKDKIVKSVRTNLKIPEIEESLNTLNFENLIGVKEGGFVLEHLSSKLGQSLR